MELLLTSSSKRIFKNTFSNSLIIHEDKTKEITAVKAVWICDPNYHKIRKSFALIFARIINALRSYIKHSKECFIRYPNTSKLAALRFFNPLLSVWISDETLFLVFDILHETDFSLLSILLEKRLF